MPILNDSLYLCFRGPSSHTVSAKESYNNQEIHEEIVQIYAGDSPSYATVKKLAAKFKQDRDSTEYDSKLGCPKISTTEKQVDIIHCIVFYDRYLTVLQIPKSTDMLCFSPHC